MVVVLPSTVCRRPSSVVRRLPSTLRSIFRLRIFTAIGALLRCLNQDLGGFQDGESGFRELGVGIFSFWGDSLLNEKALFLPQTTDWKPPRGFFVKNGIMVELKAISKLDGGRWTVRRQAVDGGRQDDNQNP